MSSADGAQAARPSPRPGEPGLERIYLLGRHELNRRAYALLLERIVGAPICVDSDFGPTSVWRALRSAPTLAVVECDAPVPDVVDAIQMLPRVRPELRVLIAAGPHDEQALELWSDCRFHGFVRKDVPPDELAAALRVVAAGAEYFSAGVRERLARAASQTASARRLSRREAELLPLLARGLSLREAAVAMSISYKTADSYRTSLLRKLRVHDRVELARYAIRRRIIDP